VLGTWPAQVFEVADIATSARRGSEVPPVSLLARGAAVRIGAVFDTEWRSWASAPAPVPRCGNRGKRKPALSGVIS